MYQAEAALLKVLETTYPEDTKANPRPLSLKMIFDRQRKRLERIGLRVFTLTLNTELLTEAQF